MKSKNVLLASAAMALTTSAPLAACDLDGLPGMGGFHRMNPFANAVRGFDEVRPIPQSQPVADQSDKAKSDDSDKAKAKDRKQRMKAIEATPVREWELDQGNGPISEADKATFT